MCAACREEKSVRGFSFLIVIFYSFQYNEAMTKIGRYTYAIQTIRETYLDDPAGGDFIYYELGMNNTQTMVQAADAKNYANVVVFAYFKEIRKVLRIFRQTVRKS